MIARLHGSDRITTPVFDPVELVTESDVEQKFLYPFLCHPSFLGIPSAWVRTKEYMTPTAIDKAAGKKYGYIPDYSIWLAGLPLVIVEAKSPEYTIEVALREARLYATEINKRYAPGLNPIFYIIASNGSQIAITQWDSETQVLIVDLEHVTPGTEALEVFISACGKKQLSEYARELEKSFQTRTFFRTSSFMGGQNKLSEQLGVNEFADKLFPVITKYFGSNSDEVPDEVIDRAYVTSDEISTYDAILETYLKDRTSKIAGNQVRPIVTTKSAATGISHEIQQFASNPAFFSRVQLVVGSVGAGKSTFIRRFYRRLMTKDVADRTRWSFINFNDLPPDGTSLREWVATHFVKSFSEQNNLDFFDLDLMQKLFSVEINQFERGPIKLIKKVDEAEYLRRKASFIEGLAINSEKFAQAVTRYYSGTKALGIIIVFDNVDKRSRDKQLEIFEAAQWFKNLTKSLVIVNLRDSTFEAYREEPPLDAFINAVNFYIRAPRFAQVIRKRLELLLESLPSEVDQKQQYNLESGYKIKYPASRLGEFMMSIYLSLFERRSFQIASTMEALVAKDVRRALGMFGDIIVSPHVPTTQITGAALTSGSSQIQEFRLIRALMRGRYRYYNGRSVYVHNFLQANLNHNRPNNLLNADILDYLIRNRKAKIDFAQEGYALVSTVVNKMGQLGYDELDSFEAINYLVSKGLIEPESLVVEDVRMEDAVRMHASGFVHMRFLLQRSEYLIGISTDLNFASREMAEDVGGIWSNQYNQDDLTLAAKRRIIGSLAEYFKFEYTRRCRRHAFYEESGLGGRAVVQALERAVEEMQQIGRPRPQSRGFFNK